MNDPGLVKRVPDKIERSRVVDVARNRFVRRIRVVQSAELIPELAAGEEVCLHNNDFRC